jgi:outer membrane biosynthesis protein TonB
MELRRIIPSDITASAVAHVSLLTLLVLFSDVRPFGAVTAEQIPVEIVTPQELAENQVPPDEAPAEVKPEPQPDFSRLDKPPADTASPPAAAPAPAAQPQKQAALATPRAAQPPPSQQVAPPPSQPAAPAYKPPEPDVSIKYQVLLGLPPDLGPPAPAQARNKGDDNFDGPATDAADIASTLIAEFRRHLKTCSKLPAALSGADDVKVKLRVLMTPDGRLAAEPILIEASASMKGPLLMQGAIRALQACQPYAMLPADRYGEWKVLDLSFTPQDFSGS